MTCRFVCPIALLAALVVSSAACGPGRTAAATQPTPAAFDPAQSEEKALTLVDQMVARLGSAEAWAAAKQIRWEHKYMMDGELQNWFKHAWDRWNGRHNFQMVAMETYHDAMASGEPGEMKWSEAMYNLFNRDKGFASYDGKQVSASDKERMIATAYERWQVDSYQLSMFYKLRDPGVKLTYFGQVKDVGGRCLPTCDTIKVEFAPEVGDDLYYININTDSGMPEIVEKQLDQGRVGYVLDDWTEVAGLKFARKFQNVGLPGEEFLIENIDVGSPDDRLYIPQVR